jgi:hypothetical protein
MPAGLPGDTAVNNLANPNAGRAVIFDLLSGPKGSPLDRDVQVPYNGNPYGSGFSASGEASTGGLSNGIGFGSPPIIGLTAPTSIVAAGFNDDYIPGVTKPDGTAGDSTIMYIGGGKSNSLGVPVPYTTGFGIGMAGKMVTATGAVANGSAVETGFTNRSGVALATGQSVFGSSTAASAVPA